MPRSRPAFKPYNRQQRKLFLESDAAIPDNHVVRVVDSAVDALNVGPLLAKYHLDGRASYHPVMMLKLLIYAYTQKIYSCRNIAKLARENIMAMWLCDNNKPDFKTINTFRGERMKEVVLEVFAEVVDLLIHRGYIKLETYFLDGTKISADANPYSWVWGKSTKRHKAALREKCRALFQEIEREETREEAFYEGRDLPELGEGLEIDSAAIREMADRIDARLAELPKDGKLKKASRLIRKDYLPRMEKYEHQEQVLEKRNSYSKTDRDATFMRMKEDHMRNGQLKPAYNVQVGTEDQFIVGYSIHRRPGDTSCLIEHLDRLKEQLKGKSPSSVIADAGYGSEENYNYLERNGIRAFVKYNVYHKEKSRKWQNDPTKVQNWFYDSTTDTYRCTAGRTLKHVCNRKDRSDNGYESRVSVYECVSCEGCVYKESCTKREGNRILYINHQNNAFRSHARDLLDGKEGETLRKRRSVEVESVFGNIKGNWGVTRFSMRGLEKVNLEWGLHAIAHNMRKIAGR